GDRGLERRPIEEVDPERRPVKQVGESTRDSDGRTECRGRWNLVEPDERAGGTDDAPDSSWTGLPQLPKSNEHVRDGRTEGGGRHYDQRECVLHVPHVRSYAVERPAHQIGGERGRGLLGVLAPRFVPQVDLGLRRGERERVRLGPQAGKRGLRRRTRV